VLFPDLIKQILTHKKQETEPSFKDYLPNTKIYKPVNYKATMQLKCILIGVIALSIIGCTTEQSIPEAKALDNIIDTAFEDLPEPQLSPPTKEPTTISINGAFIPETVTLLLERK
jgi:hypothetical protein